MIKELKQRLAPRVIFRVKEEVIEPLMHMHGEWKTLAMKELSERSLFGQQVLLVPESETFFKCLEFPLVHVKEANLEEAIALDIETWVPWDGQWNHYYWPWREGDVWRVAVWIWPEGIFADVADIQKLKPTHVIPERAWKVATIDQAILPAIFLEEMEDDKEVFSVLSASGAPMQITECSTSEERGRFWHSLDSEVGEYPLLYKVSLRLPSSRAMKYARQEGVQDWADPLGWLKPAGLVFGLYFMWLLGSAVILWERNLEISQQVADSRRDATEVIEQRENVSLMHERLEVMGDLRTQQSRLQSVLAQVSLALPEGAWIDSMLFDQTDGGWLELNGQAAQSSGLAAVLEEMPEVERAMFLSDIRSDALTGLELFRIRLQLRAVAP